MDSDDILLYWFGHIPGRRLTYRQSFHLVRRLPFWAGNWGRRLYDVDSDIRERFGDALARAAEGEYDHWSATPAGRLALILLLDQFSRNIHRGERQAFAEDTKSLQLAEEGLARGEDLLFYPVARSFFYLPLEHQEDIAFQERAVAYYRKALRGAGLLERGILLAELTSALRHRQLVRRFGRFPHRNVILGRESTHAERRFLKQPFTHF